MSDRAHLSDANLFSATLPEVWQPLCALVGELDALVAAGDSSPLASRREKARALRAQLLAQVAPILAAEDARVPAETDCDALFADAVLLWHRFANAGGRILHDTQGSSTLSHFPVDWAPDDDSRAEVRRALSAVTGLSADHLAAREQHLTHLSSNLDIKLAITAAVSAHVDRLRDSGADPALELFRAFYGEQPFRPGDISLVFTTSVLFFCIPVGPDDTLAADALDRTGGARPEAELAAISQFFTAVRKAGNSVKNIRFPAFGLFDIDAVSSDLLGDITRAVRQRPGLETIDDAVIRQTLTTMVLLVPAGDGEKFFIHDTWGHGWQETLCEFEWLFAEFATLSKPLDATSGGADGPTLGQAFVDAPDGAAQVAIDRDILGQAIDGDVRRRVKIGLNLAAAECLADLLEHKFVRQRPDIELPTSSLLPDSTLKLDLSLSDLKRATRLWRKPYLRLRDRPEHRQRLCAALRAEREARGQVTDGLEAAVDEAAELIVDQVAQAIELTLGEDEVSAGAVPSSLLARAILGMICLDHELSQRLEQGDARYRALCAAAGSEVPRWRCPPACIDLIALALGWFYEHNHALNVWHLDEYLGQELWPRLVALEAELARQQR